MGSFDGNEICELVGLFILNKLTNIIPIKDLGLYRDDGVAVLRNKSGPEMERTRKNITKAFKEIELNITAETNLFQTDFLDVTFNLKSNKFFPYRKPNDHPLYINNQSNHLPSIRKQLPDMINDRISKLSHNQESFNQASPLYTEALKNSGYRTNMTYNKAVSAESKNDEQRKKCTYKNKGKRNVIWFNPPYNEEVQTNIGKTFFNLINKHFPTHHKLHKICNKFNVKLSYSCMPNMMSIINNHNKNLLHPHTNDKDLPCNCKNLQDCPLNEKCRTKFIIYKASISTPNSPTQHYFGCCETEFKTRFYNHRQSFNHRNKANATELSKTLWKYKDKGIKPRITWSIVCKSFAYTSGAKRCNLCSAEKLAILQADQRTLLNKRSEFVSKCRHRNKFKLKKAEHDLIFSNFFKFYLILILIQFSDV